MFYAFTKAQMKKLAEMRPEDFRAVVRALLKPGPLGPATQDALVETGLFEYRGSEFVPLVRKMSAMEAAREGLAPLPDKAKPKPLVDPAEALLTEFAKYYRRYVKVDYHFSASDKATARRLVSGKGTLWIRDAVKHYIKHRRSFYPRNGKASVALLASNINDVLVRVVRPGNGEKDEVDAW